MNYKRVFISLVYHKLEDTPVNHFTMSFQKHVEVPFLVLNFSQVLWITILFSGSLRYQEYC